MISLSKTPPWACRIGWHRWRRVTFRIFAHPTGRRCRECGLTQYWRPLHGVLESEWETTSMQPNRDAHGYY